MGCRPDLFQSFWVPELPYSEFRWQSCGQNKLLAASGQHSSAQLTHGTTQSCRGVALAYLFLEGTWFYGKISTWKMMISFCNVDVCSVWAVKACVLAKNCYIQGICGSIEARLLGLVQKHLINQDSFRGGADRIQNQPSVCCYFFPYSLSF